MLLLISWIVCGIAGYGFTFGYFTREYPTVAEEMAAEHRGVSLAIALAGPIGLVVILIMSGYKHGWHIK